MAAVYTRTAGKDTLFAAVTDRQNSLTAVMDVATNKVEKFAYKPWGMRRNPANWAAEVVNDYPARFSRGYCMHEHLSNLGLINMGGRVYNARTNQFISPDPYRQAPDSWLNCNRFGYCMGNPVMYTDPDGEYFGIDDVIAMLIGGIVNSVSQCISGNVHNVGQFFSYFGVGAAAGEISIYASPVVGGMFLGGSNAVVTGAFSPDGISGMDIASGITIGGISAGAGSALSSAIAGPMSSLTSSWGNQVLSKAVTNVTASTASGFIVGTGFALGCGADWRTALSEGGKGAALGFTAGTISSVGYSVSLYKNGFNPWTGNRVTCPDSDLMPMNALVEPQNLGNSRAPKPNNLINDKGGTYSVYEGVDISSSKVKYVGITKRDVEIRAAEHYASGTERANLYYRPIDIEGNGQFSLMNARIYEQDNINYYGIDNLYNKINSISPKYWPKFNIKP